MTYITRSMIEMQIRKSRLLEALDDDKTNAETPGALESIVQDAETQVDGAIGPSNAALARAAATPPAAVVSATLQVSCYMIMRRLDIEDEKNPFKSSADDAMKRCRDIGKGDIPLFPVSARQDCQSTGAGNIKAAPLQFERQDGL